MKGENQENFKMNKGDTRLLNTENMCIISSLTQVKESFEVVFNNMSDSVILLDENKNVVLVNTAFKDLWEYSPSEVIGKKLESINGESPGKLTENNFQRTTINKNYPIEKEYHSKNGKIFFCEAITTTLKNRDNILIGYLALYRNITERKMLIDAIKNVANFPKENPNPVLRIRKDGVVLYSNPAGNFILKYWGLIVGKVAPENYLEKIYDIFNSNKPDRSETTIGEITFSINFVPVVDSNYVNLYFYEITDRKKTEEALAKSEERYRLAQRAAKIGSWEWNMSEKTLMWSDYAESIFGITQVELNGKLRLFLSRVHHEDRKFVMETIKSALEKNSEQTVEHRIILPDGNIRWVSVSGTVLRNPYGKPVRMIGTIKDITEDKSSEERMLLLSLGMELFLVSQN